MVSLYRDKLLLSSGQKKVIEVHYLELKKGLCTRTDIYRAANIEYQKAFRHYVLIHVSKKIRLKKTQNTTKHRENLLKSYGKKN